MAIIEREVCIQANLCKYKRRPSSCDEGLFTIALTEDVLLMIKLVLLNGDQITIINWKYIVI